MPNFQSTVEISCSSGNLSAATTFLRLDGVTLELHSDDLCQLRNARGRNESWVDVVLEFSGTAEVLPITGRKVEARLLSVATVRRGTHHAFLRFMNMDPVMLKDVKATIASLDAGEQRIRSII